MIQSIQIRNFRSLRNIRLDNLPRVNLIAGANNSGKTTLLEAIAAAATPKSMLGTTSSLHTLFRAKSQKITPGYESFWKWLFSDLNVANEIAVSLEGSDPQSVRILPQPHAPQDGPWKRISEFASGASQNFAVYQNSATGDSPLSVVSTNPADPADEAVAYNRVVLLKNGEERVDAMLKVIEPRLKKIRSLQTNQTPLLYADIGLDELVPVTHLGQGISRLLSIYSQIITGRSAICLIDEIENGLHHSVLEKVWEGLALAAAQENVQIFATTHSWECITAAHRCFSGKEDYDFALHRFESIDRELKTFTYDKESLGAAIQAELEVR